MNYIVMSRNEAGTVVERSLERFEDTKQYMDEIRKQGHKIYSLVSPTYQPLSELLPL
ncbi:hypothetical protein PMW_165 [Pseudomonas phage phiPMW]|uniref:Uncharacterized protein n=1 Tax=Pseudomonas phage phiPMW TaxID=1815582 RepID=A0A1S5R1J7_9CAUD|nr:hypothetical protein FDG97_gp185 [Pseudomonas phage phiPMW]ANA49290.1 hypothetical protein PMW_165 [Pseudomonas phage phiPMW]